MVWARRLLGIAFVLGTGVAAALWYAALTARCEGFGCLGVGAMIGMAFMVHLACVILGGVLLALQRRSGRMSKLLLGVEVIHLLPVVWFTGRMALA